MARGVRHRGADAVGQYHKTRSTDGGSRMKKFASLLSFAFLTLAVAQLLADCAQTNKPVATTSGSQTASQNTQPVVADHANGVGGYANGQTAMAATTDASQTNSAFANSGATDY